MRGIEELGDLSPIEIRCIEPQLQPPAIPVVRRPIEALVLEERGELRGIGEEVQRLAGVRPPRSRRRREAVVDREATSTHAEERSILENRLLDVIEGEAEASDAIERRVVAHTATGLRA